MAHELIESVVFPTKKTSEFLENPRLHSHRSAGLPGSKKSPDLSSQGRVQWRLTTIVYLQNILLPVCGRAIKIFPGTLLTEVPAGTYGY